MSNGFDFDPAELDSLQAFLEDLRIRLKESPQRSGPLPIGIVDLGVSPRTTPDRNELDDLQEKFNSAQLHVNELKDYLWRSRELNRKLIALLQSTLHQPQYRIRNFEKLCQLKEELDRDIDDL